MCYSLRFFVPLILLAASGVGQSPRAYSNVGRTPTPEEIQNLGVIVDPSGKNLPAGKGTVKEGQELYAKQCAACHGKTGEGGVADQLVMGSPGNPHKGNLQRHRPTPGILLRLFDDGVGLYQPRHAGQSRRVAKTRRSLRGGCVSVLHERDHSRPRPRLWTPPRCRRSRCRTAITSFRQSRYGRRTPRSPVGTDLIDLLVASAFTACGSSSRALRAQRTPVLELFLFLGMAHSIGFGHNPADVETMLRMPDSDE